MLIWESPLRALVAAIIGQTGSEAEEAEIVSDHLVCSNLTGHDSHGVGMLPAYVANFKAGRLFPNRPPKLIKDEAAILVFDGQLGYGQRVAKEAMEAAIDRCRQTGVVLMALRNAHHIGRIGTYGEQSIAAGMVSLHFVNVADNDPWVVPFGGTSQVLPSVTLSVSVLTMSLSDTHIVRVKGTSDFGLPRPGRSS